MKTYLITLALAGLLAAPALAQEIPQEEEEDVVTATGVTTRQDPAMAAWAAGDYVTAEIEFDKNQTCALRVERNFRAGVEAAGDSTIRADVGTDINAPTTPSGGLGGANVQSAPSAIPTAQIGSNNFRNNDAPDKRTCNDRPFDLYMRGLSQIKLGKLEEAKASLTSAVALRKTNCDAYFRLALLEIQDGDSKAARKRLKQLKKAARKNDKRPSYKIAVCDKVETEAQVAYLQAALQ